jgi:hypothetical protein
MTTFRPLPHNFDDADFSPETAGVDLDRTVRVDEEHVNTLFWMLRLDEPFEHGCEGEITPEALRTRIAAITRPGHRALTQRRLEPVPPVFRDGLLRLDAIAYRCARRVLVAVQRRGPCPAARTSHAGAAHLAGVLCELELLAGCCAARGCSVEWH